jgi:curli production assembly/transport component CsgE
MGDLSNIARPWPKRLRPMTVLLCALLCCGYAAGTAQAQSSRGSHDPYVGVVSNDAISFIGQEFYREFVATWREQPQADHFSISIHERPSARWGSLIWIEHANRQLFRTFLSPGRRDAVRLAAREATSLVYQKVVDLQVERNLYRDPDLAADEL